MVRSTPPSFVGNWIRREFLGEILGTQHHAHPGSTAAVLHDPGALTQGDHCFWPTLARSPKRRSRNNEILQAGEVYLKGISTGDFEDALMSRCRCGLEDLRQDRVTPGARCPVATRQVTAGNGPGVGCGPVDDWSRRSQADVLEGVLPSPSNCIQDPGTSALEKPPEAPRCCCDRALQREATRFGGAFL
jgi:hypothetical protein